MATIYPFKTSSYALKIYISGGQRLEPRDGFTGIPVDYRQPVKEFAAANFTMDEMDKALLNGWINQEEYDQTVLLRTDESPLGEEEI